MQLAALFDELNFYAAIENNVDWTAFWLTLPFIYLNIILYMVDLYELVKKKTPEETLIVMLLPGSLIVIGAVMLALCLQIPANASMETVWAGAVSPGLWKETLCLAGLFVFLWGLTWLLWGRKQKNRFRVIRWIISYCPDYLMVVLLTAAGCAGLMKGADLLILAGRLTPQLGYNLVLYLFLYGVKILALKTALFLLSILTQICSVRISHFPYKEDRNPTTSFLLYGTLFQNARVRGILAFWTPMVLLFVVWVPSMEDTHSFELTVLFPLFIILAFLLCLLHALRPMADNMARIAQWGDRKQILSRFCREYFLEKPLVKTRDYTVTRHFLADERGMIEVFAFDAAAELSGGWVSDPKKGWVRQLSFLDGGCCTICKDDMGADEIFRYAKQYHEMQQFTGSGRVQRRQPHAAPGEGLYHKLLYFVIAALVMLFLIMPQMM